VNLICSKKVIGVTVTTTSAVLTKAEKLRAWQVSDTAMVRQRPKIATMLNFLNFSIDLVDEKLHEVFNRKENSVAMQNATILATAADTPAVVSRIQTDKICKPVLPAPTTENFSKANGLLTTVICIQP
jgi:hypothetical protein